MEMSDMPVQVLYLSAITLPSVVNHTCLNKETPIIVKVVVVVGDGGVGDGGGEW